MSLGCGNAFEEFHFLQHNNKLILSDADLPYGTIGKWVKKCSVNKSDLVFHIEDCIETSKRYEDYFDVIYISSLHPDELYRGQKQYKFLINNWYLLIFNLRTYPSSEIYSEYVLSSIKTLKKSGLIILQHYGYTIPIINNTKYIELASKQLSKYDLSHIETWAFNNDSGNLTNIYAKISENDADNYMENLKNKKDITQLNGRYFTKHSNSKIFLAYRRNTQMFSTSLFYRLISWIRELRRAYLFK